MLTKILPQIKSTICIYGITRFFVTIAGVRGVNGYYFISVVLFLVNTTLKKHSDKKLSIYNVHAVFPRTYRLALVQ